MTTDPNEGHEGTRLRQFSALVAVAICLAVGALTASSSPLYAETYPPVGSNVFSSEDFQKNYERALTTAVVRTSTDPKNVVQHVPAKLVASLVVGLDYQLSTLPRVQVALENEASLRPVVPGAVEVFPEEPIQMDLRECRSLPGGGCELSWSWTITPRRSGTQTLLLTVSPLIYVDGQPSQKFKKRNAELPVVVEVHPVAKAIAVAQQATRTLETDVPQGWSAGRSVTVSATLAKPWTPNEAVEATISLDTPGSPQTVITPEDTTHGSGTLTQTWTVEPEEKGVLKLVFTAVVQGKAGDQELSAKEQTTRSVHVSATIWDRISAPVTWLGGIVALAAGMLGLWAGLRRLRSGDGSG